MTENIIETKGLRERIVTVVAERMAGSQEPARHTHIECHCPDRKHRRDDEGECCFCPDCASKFAILLGFPATDTAPENEGPDDTPCRCVTCNRLITLHNTPEVRWGITAAGAEQELEHWETGLGASRGGPRNPDEWREFMLMVEAIRDVHLPRVEALIRVAAAAA